MDTAIAIWTARHQPCKPETLAFMSKIRKSYVVYGDLLLLSSNAYTTADTTKHEIAGLQPVMLDEYYSLIARHMKVMHIATTKPIPLLVNGNEDGQQRQQQNVVRAPLDFTPLYGDFGPTTCEDPPIGEDFEKAYWVMAKQNGIYQTWAPRWTMFSRGNVSEKARLLTLPVSSAVEDGRAGGEGSAAVDLYAGIGYFAFSYLKAGVTKVLCWDLNAWSTEGLMRGAKANNWKAVLVTDASVAGLEKHFQDEDVRMAVFNEDNARASNTIEQARGTLPPIRHVNCGLLPTSEGSWETAVRVLDERYDGWLHVHENFAVAQIPEKAEEVREKIQRLVNGTTVRTHGPQDSGRPVSVDYVNRLKSYAPGVFHCVLDIHVPKYVPGWSYHSRPFCS